MSEIRVRWTQRVMGRRPGDEETVEHTPLIDALLANDRLEIVASAYVPPQDEPVEAPIPPQAEPVIEVPITGDTNDLGQAFSEVEFEVAKPAAPKPRAPRKE